jgi:hypothetical protein
MKTKNLEALQSGVNKMAVYHHKEHFRTLVREAFPHAIIVDTGFYFHRAVVTDVLRMVVDGVKLATTFQLPVTEAELIVFAEDMFADIIHAVDVYKRRIKKQ